MVDRKALGAARAFALAVCATGALAPLATAQPRADLARVERQRAEAAAEAARLQRQAQTAQTRIAALAASQAETARRRDQTQLAAAIAAAELDALAERQDIARARLAQDRTQLENLVISAAFAARSDAGQAARMRQFAAAAAPTIRGRLSDTRAELAQTQTQADVTAAERTRLATLDESLAAEAQRRAAALAEQQSRRARLVASAADAEQRAARLARQASSLRDLQRRLAAAAPRPATRTASTNAGVGVSAGPAGYAPSTWLAPPSGRLVRAYGAREGAGQPAQGATLRTRAGDPVAAPASGTVAYAGLFRSYGHVLILNVAEGYVVVLTGMDTMRVRTGDSVRAGQAIGDMPAESATRAPDLYVEVRRDGRLLDPGRWLAARGLVLASAD